MAHGHRAVTRSKHELQAAEHRVPSQELSLWVPLVSNATFADAAWGAEAHVLQAGCHHKPAWVLRGTQRDHSACKQAIGTGLTHKKTLRCALIFSNTQTMAC